MYYICSAVFFLVSLMTSGAYRHKHSHQRMVENATDSVAAANESICHHGTVPLAGETEGSTLLDLGTLTVDMVRALAIDKDSREVNLKDLTQLVTALAESAVLVDHPKEAAAHIDSKLAARFNILEAKVTEQLLNLSTENKALKQKLELLSQKAGVTAYLSTSVTSTGKSTQLKFNNIIYQEGSYYDESFGTFTCPVDGEYFVSSTLKRSSGNSNSWTLKIMRDAGQPVAYAAEEGNRYGSSLTTSVIVSCSALSKLWVEFSGAATVQGDYNIPYSSFVVYLLKPDVKG